MESDLSVGANRQGSCPMKYVVLAAIGVTVLLAGLEPASAQAQKTEPLVDQVKKSIDRGVTYLRRTQRDNGSWDVNLLDALYQGGGTSLAVLSLLNCAVPVTDPMVAKGLDYLRGLKSNSTYVRALQTMVFVEAGKKEDIERIGETVKSLIDARLIKTGYLRR